MFTISLDSSSKIFFSAATMLIGVPTSVKVFNWTLAIAGKKVASLEGPVGPALARRRGSRGPWGKRKRFFKRENPVLARARRGGGWGAPAAELGPAQVGNWGCPFPREVGWAQPPVPHPERENFLQPIVPQSLLHNLAAHFHVGLMDFFFGATSKEFKRLATFLYVV